MNLFQILANTADCSKSMLALTNAVKVVLSLIQWAIPIVLVFLGTIDMFKAMSSGDEKATKESQQKFVKRLIYALVAFLVPFILTLVFEFVAGLGLTAADGELDKPEGTFFDCWPSPNVGNVQKTTEACYQTDANGDETIASPTNEDDCIKIGGTWK